MKSKNIIRILVTGADGFIGKNLCLRLKEESDIKISTFLRGDSDSTLKHKLANTDMLIHLAGENRPKSLDMFHKINAGLTLKICNALSSLESQIPIIFTSSSQADTDNLYGKSKLAAEEALITLSQKNKNPISIYRLPGIFGKWARPNYNSVVATFCYNIAHGLPIEITDPKRYLRLAYIDDVTESFVNFIRKPSLGVDKPVISPEYKITLGELAKQITAFKNSRSTLVSERVGEGLLRALYATYISYLPLSEFSYHLPIYSDKRGKFVEMLKTHDSGQFSFFTAKPGITRGGHYHHSKTEKFLVIKGHARFGFRHTLTNERYVIETSGDIAEIVETVPGWSHDVTNIGKEDLVVMLWANEVFNRDKPDTISAEV